MSHQCSSRSMSSKNTISTLWLPITLPYTTQMNAHIVKPYFSQGMLHNNLRIASISLRKVVKENKVLKPLTQRLQSNVLISRKKYWWICGRCKSKCTPNTSWEKPNKSERLNKHLRMLILGKNKRLLYRLTIFTISFMIKVESLRPRTSIKS